MSKTRIYVACLHCYNGGELHGHWLDIEEFSDEDSISEEMNEKFRLDEKGRSPCGGEEFVVHDHEGFWPYRLGEVSPWEAVKIGALIAEHGAVQVDAALDYGCDPEGVGSWIEEHYQGYWESAEEFAEQMAEDTGDLKDVPQFIRWHIDWKGVARDLFMGNYFGVDDKERGGVHVFSNY